MGFNSHCKSSNKVASNLLVYYLICLKIAAYRAISMQTIVARKRGNEFEIVFQFSAKVDQISLVKSFCIFLYKHSSLK